MRFPAARLGIAAITLAACTSISTIHSEPSAAPAPGSGELRAGFGRVDLTPPPGPGLFGYGTEGARSRGHRMRLYARSLVLEDPAGERIAIVLADLGAVSAQLHRKVAMKVQARTGIGADRLILTATHTHSAPGHFFGAPAHDEQASSVEGYDPFLTEQLADGMARALLQAFAALRPARAAWGNVAVLRQTRVRNNSAAQRNPQRFEHAAAAAIPLPDSASYRYIDPQLNMLRIDVREGGSFQPAGSLMIFPVHGTMNPGANVLLDGDLHSVVMQLLERRIGSGAYQPDTAPASIHLFANGAEGDIVANFSPQTRCPAPAPRQIFWPTGPRRPPPPDRFQPVARPPFPECLQQARREIWQIGNAIAGHALQLHERLETLIQQPSARELSIARAFNVLSASRPPTPTALCRPHAGPATVGGVEGGFTRILNLTLMRTLLRADTFPSADTTLPAPHACWGAKQKIGLLEFLLAGKRPYPDELQLSVIRIGDVVIGTVPGEATTNAGARMRRALAADSTARTADLYDKHLLLGLTNGYVQYIASPYEYTAQLYEGAATLYGPHTAQTIAHALGRLARELPPRGVPALPVHIKDITIATRDEDRIVPRPRASLPSLDRSLNTCWRGDTLVARWTDHGPGTLNPAQGALLQIDRRNGAQIQLVTWDDDPFLEVWHLHGTRRQAVWEARYAPIEWPPGALRVTLRARAGLNAEVGRWVDRHDPQCNAL
jgi:neutral ceramidase